VIGDAGHPIQDTRKEEGSGYQMTMVSFRDKADALAWFLVLGGLYWFAAFFLLAKRSLSQTFKCDEKPKFFSVKQNTGLETYLMSTANRARGSFVRHTTERMLDGTKC
jgi:hypothetical protein